MQRSYGRKGPSPFDRLVNEQCQKGVVGRWSGGSSSEQQLLESSAASVSEPPPPKKKKFFKSREEPRVLASSAALPPLRPAPEKTSNAPPKKKKFFTSKNPEEENDQLGLKVPPLRLKLNASSHFKPYKEVEEEEIEEEEIDDTPVKAEQEEEASEEPLDLQLEEESLSSSLPTQVPPQFLPKKDDNLNEENEAAAAASPGLDLTETEPLESGPSSPSPMEEEEEKTPEEEESKEEVPEYLLSSSQSPEADLPGNRRAFESKTKSLTLSSIKAREETLLRCASSSASTSKRSIFKSKVGSRKAKYNHKWNALEDREEPPKEENASSNNAKSLSSSKAADSAFGFDSEFDEPFSGNLVKVSKPKEGEENETVTSIKCSKSQKSYFTVVQSVKKAHQIQDSGEFQEFNDDVEYILGGLGGGLPLSTRCLSTITLASKCMESSFRMHLRAHGTATKFFTELRDSPEKASLGLCAATVLFVLSQDRLNMDLDKNSLELMLNLLDTDASRNSNKTSSDEREFLKNREKVLDLCSAMKSKGHAKNLSLEHISADHLAMETLLSLTSKRAGEWFKEDLRELGGLDHLVRTLSECVNYLLADEITLWTEALLRQLRKADRVLKVLENVSSENEENCLYLLNYEEGKCFNVVHSLLKLLSGALPSFPTNRLAEKDSVGYVLSEVLLDVIRVYINLVHDYHTNSVGSKKGGLSDLIDIILHSLFVVLPSFVPANKSFDTAVLCLTLLINLVENCENNRRLMFLTRIPPGGDSALTGVEGLVHLFVEKESSARTEESKTDNILDGVAEEEAPEEATKKSREEVIDETIAKLLQKAGRHMEDTLIASYITLIIGYTILDNKEHEAIVRNLLPKQNFVLMVSILKKFFNFMNLTASSTLASSRGIKATEKIIKYLTSIDESSSEGHDKKPSSGLIKEEEDEADHVDLAQVSNEKLSIMEDIKPPADFDDDEDFGSI